MLAVNSRRWNGIRSTWWLIVIAVYGTAETASSAVASVGTGEPRQLATPMGRVALACVVGSAVEYYDFYIYGTAAALVFPSVFYPGLGPTMATVASMGTFATAFLSRPLGAAVFGHFGDRLGRKKTLVATLLIMAVATVTVGVVPATATIGVLAPLILILLRLLQGFAAGGEWAGSALLSAESAPAHKRGYYGMFTAIGGGIALVLSGLTFLVVNYTVGADSSAFLHWGWRIPFVLSAVLVVIALFVRLKISETPVFATEMARTDAGKATGSPAPLAEVLRRQRRELVLAAGCVLAVFGDLYLASTYLPSYAQTRLGYSRDFILLVGVLGGLTCIVFVSTTAALCDRFGRRRLMLIGWAAGLPWSLLAMPLIDSGDRTWFAVAILGIYAVAAAGFGPVVALIPELFATRYRYTGTALSINLAGIAGGAAPPLVAGTLVAVYGSWAVGVMMAALVAVSLLSTYLLPETTGIAFGSPI
ncbi:Inner membrane metabolite transport protein YhjE [Mycobacterium persicum]|uniref:Inner membrane metabolite transport protein YhjE n=2 Tax=Mycobacterium persicum TaxID=1487726 RepID=A0AB38UX82_9MYCO|nr:Inner membrane metabolite transport protein YhjE [Mycobacterium persicum]VAZ78707.1 Inner membrane metabolite transport protein YhjE [Mycobacterium kansasii]VAZ85192.1 Inner membrane metabolite transport protein YhjE [Mycobacterium persicum]VAZ97773.1 Inner membrane metabolite transport protein YhjE [Mycobacterium persicum]